MNIKGYEINAIIFDLDGTLLDSNNVWERIDKQFFTRRGRKIPEGYVDSIAHIGLEDAAIITKQKFGIEESVEDILKEWTNSAYDEYVNNVKLKPYVKKLLKFLKANNVKIALATASHKSLYIPCIKARGIYDYFDVIADVDEVKAGKDSVKLYSYVSDKLGINPSETAIVEDISIGLKTAYENNYIPIAIYDKHSSHDEEGKHKYSSLYIYKFNELIDENK